ncbi:MAG: hypothetical protein NTX49_00005 [Chlamydiae bacterium]|nr:hypothetical protein [Chlamydiota bacterium]
MTDFPKILYRTPGRHKKPRGGTYDYKGAADQEAFDDLTAKGWFSSYQDAVIGNTKAVEKPIDEVSDPTRSELESKADELGVSYDGRTSDKKLAERIAKALEG